MQVPARCDVCGMTYRRFRAPGQPTFAQVVQEMFVDNPDRSTWKRRSRGIVAGRMHEYKAEHWLQHIDACEQSQTLGQALGLGDVIPF